jgi:glycosyltransferase involved in cell wall biosynthesis
VSSRPAVSVVVPFAGDLAHAGEAVRLLRSLAVRTGDELIVADNSGTAWAAEGVEVVRASGEASPSHSRNVGASAASNDWILFLDSDVQAPSTLIDDFFSTPIADDVGAVTGDIIGTPNATSVAARYGTVRNFLGQRSHVMNPYRPRAASANLLVRKAAFAAVGGYREGIRQAEDTDFTWRLQEAGWKLSFAENAVVEHAYRDTLRGLGRQWRGYAAGAAWLSREYPDFQLDPGFNRMIRRGLKTIGIGRGVAFRADGRSSAQSAALGRSDRLRFFMIDCMLGFEEQIGLRMSNDVKPRRGG